TTGLDPLSRRNLWDYLIEIRREQGVTLFLTTHYLEEAEQADNVCILNKGKIVSRGTPEQVKADLVQEYLVLDADDRARLRTELAALALPFSETPLFKVGLDGKSAHAVLKAIETPLSIVRTHAPTLEDAYLEVVGPHA